MIILSGYGQEEKKTTDIPKAEPSLTEKIGISNIQIAGISVVGLGLAFLVIGFPTIKNVVTTVAAGMTAYKLISQLEKPLPI